MTETNTSNNRRAQHVAAFGFVLQGASLATLAWLAVWSGSDAIAALARLVLAGLPIWLVLFLVFKQLRRVDSERLETAELRRAQDAGTSDALFELDDEALLLEQNRLRWMVRWLLPAVTVVVSIYLLAGNFVGWSWSFETAFAEDGLARTENPTLVMWFIVGIGFLCFLYARYAVALSRMPHWRLLRAGATCMAGNALACLALAFALMASTTFTWTEPLLAYLTRVVLLILGLELAGNFIMDFYRPRAADVVPRPSFDSRLLGLIGEPGGLAKSIADAINYQFGFEVSSTWFYQLLQRWLFPITVFTFLLVVSLSSVVLVNADEQVVIERFGRLVSKPTDVLNPGMHFKWPYPIDVTYRAPVKRIRESVIGEAEEEDDHGHEEAILWSEAHDFVPEMMLLVASPKLMDLSGPGGKEHLGGGSGAESESVAVSLLMISVPIEYRVKDIKKYLYTYAEPERVMEALAYQYLSEYGASVDIDELMGPGRKTLNTKLKPMLQKRLDELNTGIEIVFAGIRGAHPPAKGGVADAFQQVIKSETLKSATINAARGLAQRILTSVAGTESRARVLDDVIRVWERLQADPEADQAKLLEAQQNVNDLLVGNLEKGIPPLSGEAAARIADARVIAIRRISRAAAKVRAFKTDLVAFRAAPELYMERKRLDVWAELGDIRKYLIVGDPREVIIEYETEKEGGLDEVLLGGIEKERSKK